MEFAPARLAMQDMVNGAIRQLAKAHKKGSGSHASKA